jgi:hypothetical protein
VIWWLIPIVLAVGIVVGWYGVVNFVVGYLDEKRQLERQGSGVIESAEGEA